MGVRKSRQDYMSSDVDNGGGGPTVGFDGFLRTDGNNGAFPNGQRFGPRLVRIDRIRLGVKGDCLGQGPRNRNKAVTRSANSTPQKLVIQSLPEPVR